MSLTSLPKTNTGNRISDGLCLLVPFYFAKIHVHFMLLLVQDSVPSAKILIWRQRILLAGFQMSSMVVLPRIGFPAAALVSRIGIPFRGVCPRLVVPIPTSLVGKYLLTASLFATKAVLVVLVATEGRCCPKNFVTDATVV